MNIASILLGIVDIGIVVAILLLAGVLIVWLLDMIAGIKIPDQARKLFLIIVALVAVAMVISLLLGMPTISITRRAYL